MLLDLDMKLIYAELALSPFNCRKVVIGEQYRPVVFGKDRWMVAQTYDQPVVKQVGLSGVSVYLVETTTPFCFFIILIKDTDLSLNCECVQ